MELSFSTLSLRRNVRLSGSVGGVFLLANDNSGIYVSGTNATLTLATNAMLRLPNVSRLLRCNDQATLSMSGGVLDGNSDFTGDRWNVRVAETSPATFLLTQGTTNNLRRYTGGSGYFHFMLDAHATAAAETGGVLRLTGTKLGVAMTDGAKWGWKSKGAIEVVGGVSNALEALSSDRGAGVQLESLPFYLNELRFSGANPVLTLWNGGEADNDRDSLTDATFYVSTLNLSLLSGGTVDLNGLDGAERVYYRALVNPNRVTFVDPAKWLKIAARLSGTALVTFINDANDGDTVFWTINPGQEIEGSILPAGNWNHVAFVADSDAWDGLYMKAYIDGAQAFQGGAPSANYGGGDSHPVCIGARFWPDQFLDGRLDEVRIERAGRSADWVRACWRNQSANAAFNSYGEVLTGLTTTGSALIIR